MTQEQINEMNTIRWWHRIKLPNGDYTPGEVRHGADGDDTWVTNRFGIPTDLSNKTVLDIGAWDGFFSFESEKRGAALVIAADATLEDGGNWGGTKGFKFAKNVLNSKVEYQELNIETGKNLQTMKQTQDTFDIILCYGVLYHLKSPLHAVENICKFAKLGGIILLETAVCQYQNTPVLEYRPKYANDPTNYFYPNDKWIKSSFKEQGALSTTKIWSNNERTTYRIQF